MSYENVPKNLTEQAVLVRGGRPDYSKLEAAPFPTPTLDERGAVLENTDTGNRYIWTGTTWIQTHSLGFPFPVELSARGSLSGAVTLQDQTTPTLSLHFLQEISTVAIAIDTVRDTRTVTLDPGHGAVVNDVLQISDTITGEFIQTDIISILGDVMTIDAPMIKVFTPANSESILALEDLLVDGSVTPQIFKILPIASQSGDMVAVNFVIEGTSDQDFTTFGSDAALAIGCILRVKNQVGDFRNLLSFRTNGDIIEHSGTNTFLTPKGGNSTRGFFSKITWGGQDNHGVVVRLDGALGEELQLVIQDDLTAGVNTSFQMVAQGSEIQD